MVTKHEKFKGFDIEYNIVKDGFNQYTVEIRKERNKGTKRAEYYYKRIDTYTSKLSEARKDAKEHINNIKKIKWESQGLQNSPYLKD